VATAVGDSAVTAYIAGRVLAVFPVLFGISILVFALLRLTPGDPALAIAGFDATQEQLAAVRRSLGLDQPIYVQYVRWLERIVHGDLGRSIRTGLPVTEMLANKLQNTLLLGVVAIAISTAVAIPAGIISAVRRGSAIDNAVMLFTLVGNCMPSFWTGLMLILIFSVSLRWLPTGGMYSVVGGGDLADLARHLVLPALTLALVQTALVARLMRGSMLEVIKLDHMTTARSKGLSERVVIARHAVKLALLPVVTVIGIRFGSLVGGAVIIETVFSWPGVGFQMYESIAGRDYAFIQGGVLVIASGFVLFNLVVDIAYAFIDPRIRYR
jgi:peptide/nickel transport system permease protein